MVHVRLRSRTGELDTAGLVDSGATQTLIPKELANILALGYDKGEDGTLLKSFEAFFRQEPL
jgi:predicted aspartyl protease